MRSISARQWTLLVALILMVMSCATVQEEPPAPQPEIDSAASFLQRGMEHLLEPSRYGLLALINEYGTHYPEARRDLFRVVADQEIAQIDRLLAEGDPLAARVRLGSLQALTGQKQRLVETAERVRDSLLTAGYEASAWAMNPDAADNVPQGSAIAPQDAVDQYRSILGQVHVSRSVENPDGITRRSSRTFAGSGFLVDESLLLTAYHVIEQVHDPSTESYAISVLLGDQRYTADLHGWDSVLDVAILRLEEPVQPEFDVLSRLAHSRTLDFGDEIYGLGHHSGLTETLTRGIISAPVRQAPEIGNWIQIDAPVTGGASGGMLIGPDGFIHGMLVAGLVGEDLNFAVPAADIRAVIDPFLEGAQLRRPWIGISLEPEFIGEPNEGVRVRDRFPSSPVGATDMRAGDLIVEVNHTPVATVAEAQAAIGSVSPGNIVHLQIQRGDERNDRWVLAASRPDYALYNGHGEFDRIATLYPFFGFEIDEASLDSIDLVSSEGPYSIYLYGVQRVDERTFVHAMGVRPGDRVGFIFDRFYGMTRVVRLFHLPQSLTIGELHSVDDYIYTIERGRYDQNIM